MATGGASYVDFEQLDFDSLATTKYYIDKGAFGEVYGPFTWNNRQCAFKRIWIQAGKDGDDFKNKTEDKRNIWTSMKHRNLIEIHNIILRTKALYVVMEYAGGGPLRRLLDNSAVHRQIDVSNWATQIAEGMLYLHERTIVHRDLKSQNIMLLTPFDPLNPRKDVTLKIIDFDDVKEHKKTATLSFRGTVAYTAPEVLATEQFSKASDVWSYGVVVWEMLTGKHPHENTGDEAIMMRAVLGQLALSVPESIPEAYRKLLRDCLHQDKYSRPSFDEIIDVLNSFGKTEDTLRKEYRLVPDSFQAIRRKASDEKNARIIGFTILGRQLFVVSGERSEIDVYEAIEFSLTRRWELKELVNPQDIGSCKRNKCLYILNYNSQHHKTEVLKVDSNGDLIKNWSTGNDIGKSLSVTYEWNVIIAVFSQHKLNEYSPDGQLIHEIDLSSNSDVRHPNYAIKLTSGDFVLSYGDVNELHKVCIIIGADGKLKKLFGGYRGSNIRQVKHPFCLSLDGNVFVMDADRGNHRVLLLDSDLKFKREILSNELFEHGLRDPTAILLDESKGRLLVADNESNNQRIVIFASE